MKNVFAVILFFTIISNVFGQKYVDIARLWYGNSSLNKFENSDSSTRLMEVGLDLTIPFVINSSDALLTGLFYERIETRLFEKDPETTVSVIGVRAGLSKKHSDKWSGTYLLIPKLASDFDHIGSKDFQLGFIALMKYSKSLNKNYKVGIYYNSELFGPFIVPLFGLYYLSKNEKFETNLTLPFLADLNYKLHRRLNVGLNFNGQVRSYHLTEVSATNQPGYLVKATNELFSYLKFNLTESLSVQTRLGYSVGRSYRVYDENDKISFGTLLIKVGDDRQQLNTDFADGFIYQATIVYRFMTN
ncbi:MAG: DUF6268 family outer membrane beta-barrel protein [Cyclobacteriaceae bacterium]